MLASANPSVALEEYWKEKAIHKVFLVCGKSFNRLPIAAGIYSSAYCNAVEVVRFQDFSPNPRYEQVVEGVSLFLQTECDAILAVGGGSAMDVAKCIKLFSVLDHTKNYLSQTLQPSPIPLIAVPTTAGTGSEATRFAVIYYDGEKQSITHADGLPNAVVLDPSGLQSLPEYQRKATMLDALCHGVESYWSVNSTQESRAYSHQAIASILHYLPSYLRNEAEGNRGMLLASNTAGKAINITQTTAGHAMCYKLTSLYGIAHGHAAALCVCALWPYMLQNPQKCVDPHGARHLQSTFESIASAMNCETPWESVDKFRHLLSSLGITAPKLKDSSDYNKLITSVNPVRLKNNPVELDADAISYIYQTIFEENELCR